MMRPSPLPRMASAVLSGSSALDVSGFSGRKSGVSAPEKQASNSSTMRRAGILCSRSSSTPSLTPFSLTFLLAKTSHMPSGVARRSGHRAGVKSSTVSPSAESGAFLFNLVA